MPNGQGDSSRLETSSSPIQSIAEENMLKKIRLLGWNDGLLTNDWIPFTLEEYEESDMKGVNVDQHWKYLLYIHEIDGIHHERPKIKARDERRDKILEDKGYFIRRTRHGQLGETLHRKEDLNGHYMQVRLNVLHRDLIHLGYHFKM